MLDAAFAIAFRDVMAKRSGPMYLWVDSSPQAGHDWLLSIFDYIPQERLVECMHHAQVLWQSTEHIYTAFQNGDSVSIETQASHRHDSGMFLSSNIHRHHQMPMGLGSSATTLEHKCQALAVKFLHESESFKHLREACAQVIGLTVDLGVEGGLSEAQGGDAVSYLPPWMAKLDQLRGDSGLDDGHVASDQIFPNSLISPGLDHVSNNMQDAMDKQLQGWEGWLPGFKCLAHLLSHKHLLTRLIARCIAGTGHEALKGCFETCVPSVAAWRWGTICKALPEVLRLERALRICWDAEKFMQKDDMEEDGPFQIALVTSTIRDPFWWCYGHMVVHLHEVGNFPSAWGSGCRCHEWLRDSSKTKCFAGEKEALKSARLSLGLPGGFDGPEFDCPMKGKRAPEMASGRLLQLIGEEAAVSRAETILACCSLSDEHQELVLNDFTLGVDYINLTLQVKTGQWWQTLPWMMAALAMPSNQGPGKAASCVQAVLAEFYKVPCQKLSHHPFTWKLLRPGATTRNQLEQLKDDNSLCLEDMRELYEEVCRLAFIPVVERIVEGAHSLVHRHTGYRKITGAYVSCGLRFSEMDAMMSSENGRNAFVGAFHKLRKTRFLVKSFRLQEHPEWLQLVSQPKSEQSGVKKLLNAMVYSTDPTTMFVQHPETRKRDQQRKGQKAKAHDAVFRQPAQAISYQNLKQKALLDHVGETLKSGEFYAMPASEVGDGGLPLKSLMCLGLSKPSTFFSSIKAFNFVEFLAM